MKGWFWKKKILTESTRIILLIKHHLQNKIHYTTYTKYRSTFVSVPFKIQSTVLHFPVQFDFFSPINNLLMLPLHVFNWTWFIFTIIIQQNLIIQINNAIYLGKFECRKDIHFKTQPEPVARNVTPRTPAGNWTCDPGSLDQRSTDWATEAVVVSVQFPASRGLGVAFFTTGPGSVLKCMSFQHSNLPYFKTSMCWQRV